MDLKRGQLENLKGIDWKLLKCGARQKIAEDQFD